jgi:hypothetical protein
MPVDPSIFIFLSFLRCVCRGAKKFKCPPVSCDSWNRAIIDLQKENPNQSIHFFFSLIFCYGVIQYNPNITRKPKNRERERILFKAESSVGSEAEIIGYGVKPKIKRNSDTITNQPSPAHFYTSLLGAATSFRIVALQRGGVDWITTIAGGDRNCAAAVIADATHGPNDFDKLSK